MKKIFRYIVLLIVVYLVVEIYVHFLTKAYYKDMNNYEILFEKPLVEITESKAANNKGYIQGYTANNTGEIIKNLTIRFDFYDKNDTYVGTKYKKIDIFNATEKVNFDIKYEYKNVSEIKISIVSE